MAHLRSPLSLRMRRIIAAARTLVVAIAMFASSGGPHLLDPGRTGEWTVGPRPARIDIDIDHGPGTYSDPVYAAVFGVAHNSGGSIETTLEALINGADVIEMDVAEFDGVLYSAHTPPLPVIGEWWFRAPPLERVWTASFGAEAVMLDLKESSPGFVRLVGEFLATRPPDRKVIVSSREPWVLAALRQQAPNAILLLSVPDAQVLASLRGSASTLETIDGVSIRHSLLDHDTAPWLTGQGLLVFAWTVDDLERVSALMCLGVDGITTNDLAILNLLGGQERGERELEPLPTPGTRSP